MELRGQEKDIGMPMGYGTLPQPNQESSSKLPTTSPATTAGDERRNETGCGSTVLKPAETLDHHHLHPQFKIKQQQQKHFSGRDSNPDPAPAPAPLPSSTIGGASNSETPLPPQSQATIRYRECLKNHAARMGAHVVDGCGEFMPSGGEGTPEALQCSACDCHRNFHLKEVEGEPQSGNPNRNSSHRTLTRLLQVPPSLPPQPPQRHHRFSHGYSYGFSTCPPKGLIPPAAMMAFGGGSGAAAESSSEDLNMFHSNAGAQPMPSKKRFRTKFTQEQKERMQEFAAERLGWKIQKQDEQEVQQFCAEVGVKRKVFKVWMHNNKQVIKKEAIVRQAADPL